MIRLYAEGQQIDLSKENFTLERYNPLMDFGVVRGARVLNFTLPATDRNSRIFGYINNPQTPLPRIRLKASIRFFELEAEKGVLEIQSTGKNYYEAVFTSAFAEIFGEHTNKKINEIDLGSVAIPVTPNANPTVGTDVFCWPKVKNAAFYGQNTYSGFINNYSGGVYTGDPKVPMLFLHKVFELIGTYTGVSFNGSFFDDARMKRLIVINTQSLDGLSNINYASHLPGLTIRELLHAVCNLFNLVAYFDYHNKTVTLDLADGMFVKKASPDWSRKFEHLKAREPHQKNRLRLNWKLDSNDGTLKEVPAGFEAYLGAAVSGYEGQVYDITSDFCGVTMNAGLPEISQEGISTLYGQTNKQFGARLAFWNGLITGTPQASDTQGGLVLKFGVSGGLQTLWTNFDAMILKGYTVKATTMLTGYELYKLDMHRQHAEYAQIYVQGSHYIIGEQRIQSNGQWTGTLWKI